METISTLADLGWPGALVAVALIAAAAYLIGKFIDSMRD